MTRELVDPGENGESFIDLLRMGKALACWQSCFGITMSFLKYLKVGVFVGLLPVRWHLDGLVSIFPNYNMGKSDSLFRDYTKHENQLRERKHPGS